MKKKSSILLATLIWSAFSSRYVLANLAEQCILGVPRYNKPLVSGDINQLPVNVQADKTVAHYPNNARFIGNVTVEQGNSRLTANHVDLYQTQENQHSIPERIVTATGNVNYEDPAITLKGPKGWSNLNTKDTDITKGQYQMMNKQGRGDADLMKLRGEKRYTILENGTFTSCLPTDNSWSIQGAHIIHDKKEQLAKIWHARFKIGPVPVFYSPYLQLPTGDKRRSGFLLPNAAYTSNNYFEFTQPYYWNIAPNFDATITTRYLHKRGAQWQNEFRYLLAPGRGTMALEWLPNDKAYLATGVNDSKTRWLYNWQHSGVMDKVWRFNVNYTKTSDTKYFSDLSSPYGSTTDGYATQIFSAGYMQKNWNVTLSSKQFQIFTTGGNQNAHRAQPQIDINYYKNSLGPFDFHTYGQIAKFTSVNAKNPKTKRFHIEPTLHLPLANSWGSVSTETKLMLTHYQQDIPANTPKLEQSVSRVMPQFQVDGKLVFDRPMDWKSHFTQTLEPRVQYLYVPYHNQDNIYFYDTTLLQNDYAGLFHNRGYSGLDRIASANKIISGLTSRIFDDNLVERFNVSIGQIYHLSPSRIESATPINKDSDTGSSVWVGESYWRISDNWGLRGGTQYDTRLGNLTQSNGIMEYRPDAERVLQFNYRYASPEYTQASVPNVKNPGYQQGISQAGIVAGWPLADRWAIVGAYYYDTKAKQSASELVGLQYTTCCWAANIGYERKIMGWDGQNNNSKYDERISFNISLRGFNNDYSLGTHKMLSTGILPYQHAF